MLQPLNEIILKIFQEQGRLVVSCTNETEKFYPEPGIAPRSPALCAGTPDYWATQDKHQFMAELFYIYPTGGLVLRTNFQYYFVQW